MKKRGFTVAEIFIVLAIIGVIAAITMPSFMTTTGEQQRVTAYKKMLAALSEAGRMNSVLHGYDYGSAVDFGEPGDKADTASTIMGIFNSMLQVSSTAVGSNIGSCEKPLFLHDGTAICNAVAMYTNDEDAPYLTTIVVDINGRKGPNRLSSCNTKGCTDKTGKKIYDQFYVTLYKGGVAAGELVQSGTFYTLKNDAESYASDYASKSTGNQH